MEKATEIKLAVEGGKPVRTEPLPLEFPGAHYIGQEEIDAVVRVLKSRSPYRYYGLELQKEVENFEREFAAFVGVPYAVAVSSGTGALQVALSALGVGPGKEVIVPAYSWVSVIAAVVNHGAIPVVADIDDTFGLNPTAVERQITARTAGIITVHMSGAPVDVEAIGKVARAHNLFLLEDCAQCCGGRIRGRSAGTFGDMGIFSFQLNKNMTAGEGGCVVTNNQQLYQRAVAAQDLGYARDSKGRLIQDDPSLCLWGWGYRMDELRAAVLRVQLRKLPQIIDSMHKSKYRIRKALERFPQVQLRRIADPAGDTGGFLITTYPNAVTAQRVCTALRAEGIVTHPQGVSNIVMTDWGLHLYSNNTALRQRASTDKGGFPWNLTENAASHPNYDFGSCPTADSLFERSIILAIPSCLAEHDIEDIIAAFEKVLHALSRGEGAS
ncbi:MAG TPA: DegT/DnrJ/EryC1/StrS family aminotransferase [Terriglobia bacterium]|jgi:8-amino-3,8-dideoxy-alpha-D-manno-octulosonate transaminase|nr:DegT/DnrJ/EryC1/StrS family aminotransferase [Terriglobia bacterium]